ncbi:uncharacterized protein TRIADDRAFT_25880 [Trichoplax adhaerens]|uniref:alpha-1,2-Mannosidase n=1 Tax=Trichoplax adhaerens TaxID=10228 RepID=B3RY07_TRIAD|nr:hypothetical protein TRIADDRAFT_25880 [Trichoplax adhaerens]EDV24520.1 hypothetical protein TRIADDRAFT_25880 [Trichoplax adhaerens]|eukprot:XP_002112410.1 hypothetical protein TRIADDRAFT_25880 [Trichoplax adhaerens]
MMKFAWDGYVKYAWGQNELSPNSLRGHFANIFGSYNTGATIVDALDTLYIMDMKEEFKMASDWVKNKLDFNQVFASVFETNIRFLGGLLSAYALTNDEVFKTKAKDLGDRLAKAFNSRTGIPYGRINIGSGAASSGSSAVLAEIGTVHLEFAYLTRITGDKSYLDKVQNLRKHLNKITKPNGLYPNYIDISSGNWISQSVSIGAMGDSFYEYLIKSWYLSGGKDKLARSMFDEAMKHIIAKLVKKSWSGLTFVAQSNYGSIENRMEHLACFSGGMFALGAKGAPKKMAATYLNLGREIGNTCHESYIRTATHIGPEVFRFGLGKDAQSSYSGEMHYILRPEVVETYFVLWRITRDKKYRDWGWDAAQSIEKYCKSKAGYSGISNVYSNSPSQDDVQQSFFLAETLKYLYLLFSDNDVLPLDKWVFNTEAHPLPVEI